MSAGHSASSNYNLMANDPYYGGLKYHWSMSFAFWAFVVAMVHGVISFIIKLVVLTGPLDGNSNVNSGLGITACVLAVSVGIFALVVYLTRNFDAVWGQSLELLSSALVTFWLCVLSIDGAAGYGKSKASGKQKADIAFDVFGLLGWIVLFIFLVVEYNKHHYHAFRQAGVTSTT